MVKHIEKYVKVYGMIGRKNERKDMIIFAKISQEFMADERPWCMCINCDVIE